MKVLRGALIALIVSGMMMTQAGASVFSDVWFGNLYQEAIESLHERQVVEGYEDGSYKPLLPINRAEFLKILLEARYHEEARIYSEPSSYSDVDHQAWYAPYIYAATNKGIVQGYPNGEFRPANPISYVEALKVIIETYQVPIRRLVHDGQWYEEYLQTALEHNLLHLITVRALDGFLSRGEMAQLIVNTEPVATPVPLVAASTGTITKEEPIQEDIAEPEIVTTPTPNPEPILIAPPGLADEFYTTGVIEGDKTTLRMTGEMAAAFHDPLALIEELDAAQAFFEELMGGQSPLEQATLEIVERCPYYEGITWQNHSLITTPECPYGYMWYEGAAALAGNPIEVERSYMRQAGDLFRQGKHSFAFFHEMSHVYDFADRDLQYRFDSSSREAWANIKLTLLLDVMPTPIDLNGHHLQTSEDYRQIIISPAYEDYRLRGLDFYDLYEDNPIVHSLADMYAGVILDKADQLPEGSIARLLSFYARRGGELTTIPVNGNMGRLERMNQMVLVWSCIEGVNLASAFEADRFPILDSVKDKITTCLVTHPFEESDLLEIEGS